MESNKQKAIREAYGANFEHLKNEIDEDAWLNCGYSINGVDDVENFLGEFTNFKVDNGDYYCSDAYGEGWMYWRPKSLSDIENNNGWVSINREDDLPKETNDYYVIIGSSKVITTYNFSVNSDFDKVMWLKSASHYQPIVKPEPPVY